MTTHSLCVCCNLIFSVLCLGIRAGRVCMSVHVSVHVSMSPSLSSLYPFSTWQLGETFSYYNTKLSYFTVLYEFYEQCVSRCRFFSPPTTLSSECDVCLCFGLRCWCSKAISSGSECGIFYLATHAMTNVF